MTAPAVRVEPREEPRSQERPRRGFRLRTLSGRGPGEQAPVFAQPWDAGRARDLSAPRMSSELPASHRWPRTNEAEELENWRLEVVADVARARRAYEAGALSHRYGRGVEFDVDLYVGRT